MNLSVYLSELLKTNDCVIIPDLGGFIANYQSSGYNSQLDQFSPPSKEIIFSSKLKKNDGLLVNYVGEKEGVGYLEARKIVSEIVAEYLFRLENGERIELDQIGSLHFDQNENLLFEAAPMINLRADTFGLDAFHFPQLVQKYNHPPKPNLRDKDPEPQRNRRQVVKYLLIGLPFLVALYFVPYNKLFNHGFTINQPISNNASLSIADTPVTLNSKVQESSSVAPVTLNSNVPEPLADHKPVEPVATPKVMEPEKSISHNTPHQELPRRFHVVGGCFKIRENADKQAAKLIKQGYPAEVSVMGGGFFRVSVESYQTRQEAERGLSRILDIDPDTDYWLMADKK
jgi:cell division septation protein DedD